MHILQRVYFTWISLLWRHKERNGVSNHRRLDSLLNCLFRRRSKKTSKLRYTGLCYGNLPMTGDFPAQRASNAENVSIWWRHHVIPSFASLCFLLTSFIFMTNKKLDNWELALTILHRWGCGCQAISNQILTESSLKYFIGSAKPADSSP